MSEEQKKEAAHSGDSFTYTYSSRQQAEVKAIRKKYLPREEDKMERLRRLDRSATQKGSMAAIIVGTVSSSVMGPGMSMTMVWTDTLMAPGIIIGLLGMVGVAGAYPLYSHITRKERERIAPEVLRLTEELLK